MIREAEGERNLRFVEEQRADAREDPVGAGLVPVVAAARTVSAPPPAMSAPSALASASKLGDLLAQLPLDPPKQWPEIESTAQSLANELRTKDGSLPLLFRSLVCSVPIRALQLTNRRLSESLAFLRPLLPFSNEPSTSVTARRASLLSSSSSAWLRTCV